ncbi:hypothetical protein ABW19_dt0210394 [Dactylella cylindrospora]|nr:hypothetical protein ABW19_dt0210394 [Dactylella cylindrospora]
MRNLYALRRLSNYPTRPLRAQLPAWAWIRCSHGSAGQDGAVPVPSQLQSFYQWPPNPGSDLWNLIDTGEGSDTSFAAYRSRARSTDIVPFHFPRFFSDKLPAFKTWFLDINSSKLNIPYMLSHIQPPKPEPHLLIEATLDEKFNHTYLTWSEFLNHLSSPTVPAGTPSYYLAQQEPPSFLLPDIPPPLPHLGFTVRPPRANRSLKAASTEQEEGLPPKYPVDIYSSSLWLSRISQPSNTPLHRDPNDNIYIQLSGEKEIRCLPPSVGNALFQTFHGAGKWVNADPTGKINTDMMDEGNRRFLDSVIWGGGGEESGVRVGLEVLRDMRGVRVRKGDGVYIPKGWWHSVRSVPADEENPEVEGGVVASVNWWFR